MHVYMGAKIQKKKIKFWKAFVENVFPLHHRESWKMIAWVSPRPRNEKVLLERVMQRGCLQTKGLVYQRLLISP